MADSAAFEVGYAKRASQFNREYRPLASADADERYPGTLRSPGAFFALESLRQTLERAGAAASSFAANYSSIPGTTFSRQLNSPSGRPLM